MIYCLVNNTYHYTYLKYIFNTEFIEQLRFIIIPVNFKEEINNTYLKVPPFSINKLVKSPLQIRNQIKNIKNVLSSLTSKDKLIVFSEINIHNQIIINEFASKSCKIFMCEDGMATPILFNLDKYKRGWREKFIQMFGRYYLKLNKVHVFKLGTSYASFLPDKHYTCLFQTENYPIKRVINRVVCPPKVKQHFFGNSNIAIFFNQNLYDFYLEFDLYLDIIEKLILQVNTTFEKTYFKFHPNEKDEERDLIKKRLKKYHNIIFLENQTDITVLNISYGLSFFSTALMEFKHKGLIPIYTYHFFPEVIAPQLKKEMDNYLTIIGYKFIPHINNLKSVLIFNRVQDTFHKVESEENFLIKNPEKMILESKIC